MNIMKTCTRFTRTGHRVRSHTCAFRTLPRKRFFAAALAAAALAPASTTHANLVNSPMTTYGPTLWSGGNSYIGFGATGSYSVLGSTTGSGYGQLFIADNGSPGATRYDLFVGDQTSGNGTLTIGNGGLVAASNIFLAASDIGSKGNLTVTGVRPHDGQTSTLDLTGSLTVGAVGNGTATLAEGGIAHIPGGVIVGALTTAESAASIVNIGNAATEATTASAGILDAPTLTGNGTVQFNHTDTAYFTRNGAAAGPTVAINGNLRLVQTAGHTVLTSGNGYTGATTVNGGELEVRGNLGNGNYAGPIEINDGTLHFNQAGAQTLSSSITSNGNPGDAGNFHKSGTGTLTVTDANPKAITGEYRQTGGTVNLATDFTAGTVTVQNSTVDFLNDSTLQATAGNVSIGAAGAGAAVVTGTGSIAANAPGSDVSVHANSIWTPGGAGVGTIQITATSNITLAAGWQYAVNITGSPAAGVNNDIILLHAGSVTLEQIALSVLIPPGAAIQPSDVFTIISSDSILNLGAFAGYDTDSSGHSPTKIVASNGWTFEVAKSTDGKSIVLQNGVAPVPPLPEPGTYALFGGLAVLGVALWRRRRAKRSF